MKVEATYVSVWDGGVEMRTKCKYDPETRVASDIEQANVGGVDNLDREYIELQDGTEIERNRFYNGDCGESPLSAETVIVATIRLRVKHPDVFKRQEVLDFVTADSEYSFKYDNKQLGIEIIDTDWTESDLDN